MKFFKNKWVIISIVATIAICAIVIPIACVFGKKKNDPITQIKVDTTNAKLTYELNEEFSNDGLVVRAVLKSGKEDKINDYSVNSDAFNSKEVGDYQINIVYGEFSDNYTVKVIDNSDSIIDISLDTTGVKTIYDFREPFSSDGLIVRTISEKGKTTLLDSEDFTVTCESFNNTRTGEYEVVVTYGTFIKKYNVNVLDLAKNVISMSIDTSLVTKVFDLNDPNGFNSDGLIVRTKTESGIETSITTYTIDQNGFDITREGTYTIKVKYATFEKTYEVEVKKLVDNVTSIILDTSLVQRQFNLGDRFNSDNLVVRTRTESGVEARVTGFTVNSTAYNNTRSGSYEIIVSYEGLTARYTVTVLDDPTVAIGLDTSLAKTVFNKGESFSSDGLVVYSISSSGRKTKLNVIDYYVNHSTFDKDNTTLGNRTITVTYNYALRVYSQTYTVKIVDDPVVAFSIDSSNVTKVFDLNGTFSADGIIVRLIRESGLQTVVTDGYTIDDVDLSQVSDSVAVTVRYGSLLPQSYTISVVDPTTEDIKGFTIDTSNVTKIFNLNDENGFNSDGLIVRAVTNSNKEIVVTNSNDITINADEFDITKEGTYTIYVSYRDYDAKTYSVQVIYPLNETIVDLELDTSLVTKEFEQDSNFNYNGLIVYKIANNGNKYPTTRYTIDYSEYNSTKAGIYTIFVKFADDETIVQSYDVTVTAISVTLSVIDSTMTGSSESNVKIYVNNIEQTGTSITVDKYTDVKLVFTGIDKGYIFNGWFSGENIDLESDVPISTSIEYSFNIDQTMTISSIAQLKTYNVTFTGMMPDGVTPVTDVISETQVYSYGQSLPTITETDTIKFDGWAIVLESGETDNKLYTNAIFDDTTITLTPVYSEKPIMINFNLKLENSIDETEVNRAGTLEWIGANGEKVNIENGETKTVKYSESHTLVITPQTNYKYKSVYLAIGGIAFNISNYVVDNQLIINSEFLDAFTGNEFEIDINFVRLVWTDEEIISNTHTLSGAGSETNPFLIQNAEEFAVVAYYVNLGNPIYSNSHYRVTTNIDFAGRFWEPIGTPANPFNGTINLGGFTFANIEYYKEYGQTYYQGLFNTISDTAVINSEEYTINFVVENGSAPIVMTEKVKYGQVWSLESLTEEQRALMFPSKEGFTLSGYFTEANGNGVKYIDGNGDVTSEWSNTGYIWNGTSFEKETNFDSDTKTFTLYAYWVVTE